MSLWSTVSKSVLWDRLMNSSQSLFRKKWVSAPSKTRKNISQICIASDGAQKTITEDFSYNLKKAHKECLQKISDVSARRKVRTGVSSLQK